eukprot:5376804-Alexandrium_andersonii.AAC.1
MGGAVGVGAAGRFSLNTVAQQPADMGSLREGGAGLKQRPFTAIGRPEPPVDGLAGEPNAGLSSVLRKPKRKVRLLPGRFGAQPAGELEEMLRSGKEGTDRL